MLCRFSIDVFTVLSDSNTTQSFLMCVKVYHFLQFCDWSPCMLCSSSIHVFTDLSDSNSTQSFLLCVKMYHIHNL